MVISCLISCKREKELHNDKTQIKKSQPFVIIDEDTLLVEISDTDKKRQLGLMFRDELDKNSGMLFIFDNERILSFWMKNTKIPLSIAFINSDKIIVDMQDMQPLTETEHTSRFPAIYALEVNKGWFRNHNIKVGDRVYFHF
ncbi:MAG: hypothetical protein B5M53_05980 [Candidatus Cloacimonas sp. 4484_209]|nr:MAG: hypothetical protein B5M53_05980 [Candidatus Cloacimonas sp. 4484_209]